MNNTKHQVKSLEMSCVKCILLKWNAGLKEVDINPQLVSLMEIEFLFCYPNWIDLFILPNALKFCSLNFKLQIIFIRIAYIFNLETANITNTPFQQYKDNGFQNLLRNKNFISSRGKLLESQTFSSSYIFILVTSCLNQFHSTPQMLGQISQQDFPVHDSK